MCHKIFIDGQEGTTGLKIRKRLQGRTDLELLSIADDKRKDPAARHAMMKKANITFLCLPDAASREIAALADQDLRILDTSTAHRTDSAWTYGFPELIETQRDQIRQSNRVSVPGCHATGFIALVKPLIARKIIGMEYPLACHSITGYSGGGKSMIARYEDSDRDGSFDGPRQYGLDQNHKHLAEMVALTGISAPPVFHPIVAGYFSGMLVTIPLHRQIMKKKIGAAALQREFSDYYRGQSLIKVREPGEKPGDGFMAANALADTDGLEIFILGNDEQISLMARYDNLGKGASGAAIQCMNIMLDLPEETGLVLTGGE